MTSVNAARELFTALRPSFWIRAQIRKCGGSCDNDSATAKKFLQKRHARAARTIFPNALRRYVDKWLASHRFLSRVSQGNSTRNMFRGNYGVQNSRACEFNLSPCRRGFSQRSESFRCCKTSAVELRTQRRGDDNILPTEELVAQRPQA